MAIFNEAFLDRFKKSKPKHEKQDDNKSNSPMKDSNIGRIVYKPERKSTKNNIGDIVSTTFKQAFDNAEEACSLIIEDAFNIEIDYPESKSIKIKKTKENSLNKKYEIYKCTIVEDNLGLIKIRLDSVEVSGTVEEISKKYGFKIEFIDGTKTTSTNEAVEWHGKYFLSKEELHDPKFRSSQFKKVNAIIRNCLKSESFNKEFTAVPSMYDYFEDDDSNDVLKKWTYESKKSRVLSMCYFPDKQSREDGTAKDSADFIMKAFEKAKKDDPKNTFGKLKYDEDHGQIDYKL